MKNCNKTVALALAVLALSACGQKAHIRGNLSGAANKPVVVKLLDVNTYRTLDTIKTRADGSFRYDAEVKKGQPEFIYLFHGDTRIAALLLETGETAVVKADTLGNFTVEGSKGSSDLAVVDKAYADFHTALAAHESTPVEMTRDYINHYRESVKYVLAHPYSLTTVPVLFERLGEAPIFAQLTDGILFRNAADSLKTVYPDSRYVKALQKEADSRMRMLEINNQVQNAPVASFPDIVLPDIKSEKRTLSEVDAKVVLVHFWDLTDAAQKMLSLDALMPLYNEFHSRGFEIYSICVTPDKPEWASVVLAQKLPWINVNDGLGGASPAVITYNVTSLPDSFLIVDGELNSTPINGGVDGLRKELRRLLK